MEGGEAISNIKLFHSAYVQLLITSLQLWAASCERTSHVNIGPNTGLWHRINTFDTEKKGIIRLFSTMELIQAPAKLRWTSYTISGFSLNRHKFRSIVHESGKPAALQKHIIKATHELTHGLRNILRGTFNKCGHKVKSEPTLCDDLRHESWCQKVDLSPFSAALIEEMALQPKGTVAQQRAISSDCSCSEIQLHQFIDRHEDRAIWAKQSLAGFYLLAQKSYFFFKKVGLFLYGQLSVCLCHL